MSMATKLTPPVHEPEHTAHQPEGHNHDHDADDDVGKDVADSPHRRLPDQAQESALAHLEHRVHHFRS